MMQEIELKYRDKIRKLNISLLNPPIRSPSKAQLIIIRHAFSEINLKMLEFLNEKYDEVKENKQHPERKELVLGSSSIDSPLHPIVSPLKRALQTCIYLFATHPNRKNIQFIVFPHAAEKLSTTSSFSPETLGKSKEEIAELASQYDITFDYSMFDQFEVSEHWQIEMLCHDHFELKQKLEQKNSEIQSYKDFVIQEFEDHFPEYLETWEQLYERSEKVKEEVEKRMKQTDKKVCLISHGYLIKCLTSQGVVDDTVIKGIDIKNCQIVPYPNISVQQQNNQLQNQ